MRPSVVQRVCAATLVAGTLAGCQQPVRVAPAPAALETELEMPVTGRAAEFSSDAAWEHLRALTAIGARVSGTPASASAAAYIQTQLATWNIDAQILESDALRRGEPELEAGEEAKSSETDGPSRIVRHISATIPGASETGSLILIAPYDTTAHDDFEFIGANDGGSGAAVLLELSRVIAGNPLPYATEVVFVDAHAAMTMPGTDSKRLGVGYGQLALEWRDRDLSDAHMVVYLNRIGDADLRIARDLLSHRIYREEFWKAAQRLGRTDAFRENEPFESTGLRHRALAAIGLRRIVSIVDTSFGGDEPPGLYAGTEQDTLERCSRESLGTVGVVVLEGLESISKWLVKIDRMSQLPNEASPLQPMIDEGASEQLPNDELPIDETQP